MLLLNTFFFIDSFLVKTKLLHFVNGNGCTNLKHHCTFLHYVTLEGEMGPTNVLQHVILGGGGVQDNENLCYCTYIINVYIWPLPGVLFVFILNISP